MLAEYGVDILHGREEHRPLDGDLVGALPCVLFHEFVEEALEIARVIIDPTGEREEAKDHLALDEA